MRLWVLALSVLLLPCQARAQAPAPNETAAGLEGLWASQNAFGPDLSGALVLTREGGLWHARLGDQTAQSATLDIGFPNGEGRFRAAQGKPGEAIQGWWIQPPGLSGQSYASPIRLAPVNANSWRGAVQPLNQTFTLYLRITRNEEGRWIGAFRNPEYNFNGGASRFLVGSGGGTVAFSGPGGDVAREASVAANPERLRMSWPPLAQPVELTRGADATAEPYAARSPQHYALVRPQRTHDGWRTARAKDVGFDEAALVRLVQGIIDSDPAARRPLLIHSILIARRGRLVLEEYFHGYDRDAPHDIRSAGKTFASAMLGAAIFRGVNLTPETPVYDLLADQGPFAHPDPRKHAITLARLMTHTSGLDCNDNDDCSRGNEGAMQGQDLQPDWWRFALDLPVAHDPGARYAYCTAGMNLIGAALHSATGEHVPDLFDRFIARPLQFGRYYWNLMPNGEGYLGGGAYLRPRDLLKLGQLYLDGGAWNGVRLVSRDWVARSTAAQVAINEATTGMDAETFANVATHGADGFGWHRYGVRVGERRVEAFEANGNGGQFLIVVPEYALAVVLTGGNYGQGGIWTRWRDEIVGGQIIAALRR